MPTTYLRADLYNAIVAAGLDPNEYLNRVVQERLKKKPEGSPGVLLWEVPMADIPEEMKRFDPRTGKYELVK